MVNNFLNSFGGLYKYLAYTTHKVYVFPHQSQPCDATQDYATWLHP